jgi:basic amino acid/polyamine antiporter, APA family
MDKKALTLPILISLVIGNMIGTGIYVLPASLAQYGTISILAWVFTSVGALFLALTFANLSKRITKTGGPYIYCKEAYGNMVGFIVAYSYWIGNLVSIAGITVASIGYLGYLTPILDSGHPAYSRSAALMVELGVIWLFTSINIIGIHTAGVVQLILTCLKLIPLLLISIVGLGHVELVNLSQFSTSNVSNFTAICSASALTFWAFIGLEAATIPAENTPGYKAIYIATVFGTLIAASIYIISTFVLMGMIPVAELKNMQFPFAEAGKILFGSQAGLIIALCAVLSGLGALNVCILIQGQIVFAAARDHLFPHRFAKLSKHDVPIAAQLFSTTLVSIFLALTMEPTLLKQFNNIALLAGVFALINYFLTTTAEIKFLFTNKLPFMHVLLTKPAILAVLAGAYSVWMITNFNLKTITIGLAIMLLCIPIYFLTVRRVAKLAH